MAQWVDELVNNYSKLDEKYHVILAAADYNTDADDNKNKEALKANIFYEGDEKAGTWTIKLDTAVLGEEKVEFLVTVRDDAGAQWGNNNYVAYPNKVQAYLYNVTIPEEPKEYHTYKFNIEGKADVYIVREGLVNPSDDDFKDMTSVKLSIVVDEEKDKPYEGKVRVAPVKADGLQLWARDTTGNWYDINEVGWGPPEGFVINPELVTPVYVIATKEFDGNVTLKLEDITGNYGAEDNIIISQEVAFKAVIDPLQEIIDAYSIEANYENGTITAAFDKYLDELPEVAEGYEIDVLITLSQELPEGTEIAVTYNGNPVPVRSDWRNNFNESNQIWLGEGILNIGGAKPFTGGAPGNWTITISGNKEGINTTVKIESAISNDDFKTWVVIAEAEVTVALDAANE